MVLPGLPNGENRNEKEVRNILMIKLCKFVFQRYIDAFRLYTHYRKRTVSEIMADILDVLSENWSVL